MPITTDIPNVSSSSHVSSAPEETDTSYAFTSPFTKHLSAFTRTILEKIFPKKNVSPLPSHNTIEGPSFSYEPCGCLDFDKLVEAVALKIWGMLREHLKQINKYHEEQEKLYKDAIKAQVKSYLSWVGTAIQVASIATGIVSISFTLLPGLSTELCKGAAHFLDLFNVDWYHNMIQRGAFNLQTFPEAARKSLETTQGIFNSSNMIHNNYVGADRTSAQGEGEIRKSYMERISRKEEESRNERSSVIQTIQQTYQQESETRKALSR